MTTPEQQLQEETILQIAEQICEMDVSTSPHRVSIPTTFIIQACRKAYLMGKFHEKAGIKSVEELNA